MKHPEKRRIVIPQAGMHFYQVVLTQTIGAMTIRAVIRHVNAGDLKEAGIKAIMFHMRRNPNSEPSIVSIDREPYDRPIKIIQ